MNRRLCLMLGVLLLPAAALVFQGCENTVFQPIDYGNPEPNRPTGDPDASPLPGAGDAGDTADERCPLTTSERAWTWSSSSSVRSILIHDSVYVASDHAPPTIPLRSLSLTTGAPGAVTEVQRPDGPSPTHLPRLQAVPVAGQEHLVVSYLRREYVDDDGATQETPGGIAWVGPLGQALPASASLISGVDDSVDGVFRYDNAGLAVLAWPSLAATDAKLHRLALDSDAGVRIVDSYPVVGLRPASFERAGGVYRDATLELLIRSDGKGDVQSLETLDVSPNGASLVHLGVQENATTWAPLKWKGSPDDVNGPTYFAVTPAGIVTRYALFLSAPHNKRELTVLPQGFRADASSAKMVHTNGPRGSIVFPGFRNGAPRLFRVHVYTGALDEWPETAADTPNEAFGWSALDADRGVVCYANASNVVRCGCMNSVFKPVY
jgi:hypothetical protein